MTVTITAAGSVELAGTDVSYPKAQGYGALVGDLWVRLAPNAQQDVRIYSRDSLAQRSDDTGSTYDNVLDIGYSWSRDDVSGGEGLDYDPRLRSLSEGEAAGDLIRFWESDNIDVRRPVRGDPYTFQLAHAQEIWATHANLSDLATSDDYLHVAYGSLVERWSDWTTLVDTDSTSSDVDKIVASPDGDVAALLDDGTIEMFTIATSAYTAVPLLTGALDTWFVKGRFVALINNGDDTHSLVEYTDQVVGTAFDTFRGLCRSMVSSGPAIVAAIDDGTLRSYVPEQANQSDPLSVNLVIRGRTEVPEGEVPYLLGANAGILLVLTRSTNEAATNDARLYQAEVLDARFDYTVGQLRLRREWDATYETVDIRQNMATTRDEIWFTVQETQTEDSVWRFDLVTLGITRHRTISVANTHSVVIFDEEEGFISTTDVYKTNDNYQPEGWLISPNITFGLNTDIAWLETVLFATNLSGSGKQVELWYTTDTDAIVDPDDPSWVLASRISTPAQDELSTTLTQLKSKSLALMVRIYSSEATGRTPKVKRFAVRGIPTHRDWILELPVNVSDWISAPGRSPVRIPTYGDTVHTSLVGKIGENLEIIVLDPPFGFSGVIDNVLEPVSYITDRGSVSVRCVLQCRGSRIVNAGTPTGDAGLGLGLLGVTRLGIGQTDPT